RRPRTCSPRSTPTVTCRPPWPTATPTPCHPKATRCGAAGSPRHRSTWETELTLFVTKSDAKWRNAANGHHKKWFTPFRERIGRVFYRRGTHYESFDGKVALVTGAGSGMGLATAKAFAEAGASVVLADSHEEAVRAAT